MQRFIRQSAGWMFLGVIGCVGAVGCAQAQPTTADAAPSEAVRLAERTDFKKKLGADAVAILHYHRPDGDYRGWNVWAWEPGRDGAAFDFEGEDAFGRYAVIPLDQNSTSAGFIIRRGEWESKDVGHDRTIKVNQDGIAEYWVVSGDPNVYDNPAAVDLTTRIVGAFLDGDRTVTLSVTSALTGPQRKGLRVTAGGDASVYSVKAVRSSEAVAAGRVVYDVVLDQPVQPDHVAKLSLRVPECEPVTVYARDVLSGEAYTAPDAELGYRYSPEATVFRTWSPVSDAVEVLVYADAEAQEPAAVAPMKPAGKGVWEVTLPGDFDGSVYRLRFTSYGEQRVVPDIHAFAATADSSRSVVLDLDRLTPDGWAADAPPRVVRKTDEVIYEIHVRDFSIADKTCPPRQRGTYLGLIHKNPGDPSFAGGVATGLSHLQELGVTAVHLLPIEDFTSKVDEYNWGYWTAMFNSPETNYATDPHDPAAAIRELRTAVVGLHDADLRVILDVVYNHTSSSGAGSPFEQTVPYYYFRTTPDGQMRNDAGVGNSIADERPMVRKFIVDSLVFWADQYHVDGFRFDLLGTHHPETVAAVTERLHGLRADLTLYGEPWTGGGPTYFPKGAQKGSAMAVFNDHLRNAIRGDTDGTKIGFATGPGGDRDAIRRGVAGAIDDFTTEPTETINYASAHDNLTLWDKIAITAPRATDAQHRAMQKLALGVVLTSQGVPFLHGGSDFARTKGGNHNSYNAGDQTNAFDWARKAEYRDVFDFVAGVIAMRRAHPAFRMDDDALVRKHLRFLKTDPLVAYTLDGGVVGDRWKTIVVAYNGEPTEQTLDLPAGAWSVAVDGTHASATALNKRLYRGEVPVPAYGMVVFFR